jgi:transposase InsO family protein
MRRKDDTTAMVCQFLKGLSQQFPNDPVQTIRTDRGGEFGNLLLSPTQFMQLLISKGIRHEFSSTQCPQQNGTAERRIQTLSNITRALLI